MCVRACVRERERVCVCERKSVCACVRACVRERTRACLCARVRKKRLGQLFDSIYEISLLVRFAVLYSVCEILLGQVFDSIHNISLVRIACFTVLSVAKYNWSRRSCISERGRGGG